MIRLDVRRTVHVVQLVHVVQWVPSRCPIRSSRRPAGSFDFVNRPFVLGGVDPLPVLGAGPFVLVVRPLRRTPTRLDGKTAATGSMSRGRGESPASSFPCRPKSPRSFAATAQTPRLQTSTGPSRAPIEGEMEGSGRATRRPYRREGPRDLESNVRSIGGPSGPR